MFCDLVGSVELGERMDIVESVGLNEEPIGLIADLLSISTHGKFPEVDAHDSQQRGERTLLTLERYLEGHARGQPVLSIFGDVHWSDPSTLEMLNRSVDASKSSSALTVVTTRPGFEAPWTDAPHVTVLSLSRLARDEVISQ